MYSHTKYEVLMTPTNGTTTASGNTAFQGIEWSPAFVPHIIRGFAVTLVSGGTVLTSGQIKLQHLSRVSGSLATDITTINLATTDTIGRTVYKRNLNVEVAPGNAVFVNVPTAIANGPLFRASIYVEPRWENPVNVANTREST